MTWWAAKVASKKEYDTKREIVKTGILPEDDVIIPRKSTCNCKGCVVTVGTELMLPGYILLKYERLSKVRFNSLRY